jgi:nucleotide-binding universal stress UspA family protein
MRIGIAIDGSENSLRALREAIRLGKLLKDPASLVLINVHLSALISPVARGIDRKQIESYMDQIAEEELADAKRIVAEAGMSADIVKGHGEVAPTILETLQKEKIEMLVLGGKGRSSVTDLLLGSITTKLISLSPIPVIVVK